MLSKSRFNPKPGILDFWTEFRKPNPLRWPILVMSTAPFALIFYWLSGETVYKTPDRPTITYITTFSPDRTDEEIVASNIANQEVRDLREAQEEQLAQRKREMYKALGAAAGMDVNEIERRADENRAAEEAEEAARREELIGRSDAAEVADASDAADPSGTGSAPSESPEP